METLKIFLQNLLAQSNAKNALFRRNLAKEYLQLVTLDFIYAHPQYSQLVLYGGSCLAHCHGLPRLSEDLDFVDLRKKIELSELARDLTHYFHEKTDLSVKTSVQKFRLYLKFPLLRELGLAKRGESDLLFLKVEIFSGFDFCRKHPTEIIPLFKSNRSLLIRTFDLPTLMATKIRAILYRQWQKTDQAGKITVRVKGRDYYDLMWYLSKGITPNWDCLGGIRQKKSVLEKLRATIEKVDGQSLKLDLEALLDDPELLKNLSGKIRRILLSEIGRL
jgi:predicted nucleotidyltransferase component of viral defense system